MLTADRVAPWRPRKSAAESLVRVQSDSAACRAEIAIDLRDLQRYEMTQPVNAGLLQRFGLRDSPAIDRSTP